MESKAVLWADVRQGIAAIDGGLCLMSRLLGAYDVDSPKLFAYIHFQLKYTITYALKLRFAVSTCLKNSGSERRSRLLL